MKTIKINKDELETALARLLSVCKKNGDCTTYRKMNAGRSYTVIREYINKGEMSVQAYYDIEAVMREYGVPFNITN